MKLRVRAGPVDAETWARTRALLSATPMGGALPAVIQRAEDAADAYFSLGGTPVDVVAEAGGKLLGYAHGRIERRMLWNGHALVAAEVFMGGDLRVAPEGRGRGLIRDMFDALRDHCAQLGVRTGWGLINEGNQKPLDILRAGRHGQRTEVVRTFVTASRLLVLAPGPLKTSRLEAFTPLAGELEALSALWAHRFLAPAPAPGAVHRAAARRPELLFLRRKEDGAFVCALWNPRRARQIVLTAMPPLLRLARGALRLLPGARPLPTVGQPLETVETAWCVREHLRPEHVPELVHHAFSLGGHVLNLIEEGLESPPRVRATGVVRRLRTHLVTYAVGGEATPSCPPDVPVFLDLAAL